VAALLSLIEEQLSNAECLEHGRVFVVRLGSKLLGDPAKALLYHSDPVAVDRSTRPAICSRDKLKDLDRAGRVRLRTIVPGKLKRDKLSRSEDQLNASLEDSERLYGTPSKLKRRRTAVMNPTEILDVQSPQIAFSDILVIVLLSLAGFL
jgi:hypothetical protein